jgi:hypothetical protein
LCWSALAGCLGYGVQTGQLSVSFLKGKESGDSVLQGAGRRKGLVSLGCEMVAVIVLLWQ